MSLKLADIFTNHMVLQRDRKIPIWGSSECPVHIHFGQEVIEADTIEGKWFTYLSPNHAGGPFELMVTNQKETITLNDVYLGDVFIAGGQSNMEFELQKTLNGEQAVQMANDPLIRYYQVPKIEFEDPNQQPPSSWTVCSKETAGLYSAVAYHFAKNLDQNIPIGLIGCNWGGTSASCWMSREALEENEEIKIYLDDYDQEVNQFSLEEYEEKRLAYIRSQEEHWLKYCDFKEKNPDIPEHLVSTHIGDWPWPPPMGPKSFLRPAGLYYTMLEKFAPYACKAVLWYQGESDTHRPKLYKTLLKCMIENWRALFNDSQLPFLIVQLPGYTNGNEHHLEYAYLRESQQHVSEHVPNTHMIVSIDCGERDDIHPINKEPIGQRLALLAKAKLYQDELIYSGPVIKNVKKDGNEIILTFEHVGSGLIIKGDVLKGFKISGDDLTFIDCEANLSREQVILSSPKVDHPMYVRYSFENYPEGNLYNQEGLPLRPFRTDLV